MKKLFLLLMISAGFVSCISEEDPVQPFPRGDLTTGNTGDNDIYYQQVYYDLSSNTMKAVNNNMDWDIGFEGAEDGFHIILNFGRLMKAVDLGPVDFDSVTEDDLPDKDSPLWEIDHPEGKLDSGVFAIWWDVKEGPGKSLDHVYIVDRGPYENRASRYLKMKINGFADSVYSVSYEYFHTGDGIVYNMIVKDNDVNFTCFSFAEGGKTVNLQPDKNDWDILFSTYTEKLWDGSQYLIYSVRGALINYKYCAALYLDSAIVNDYFDGEVEFSELDYDSVKELELLPVRNEIGHDWKRIIDINDPNLGYEVKSGQIYIIKDTDGFLYKLHFIGYSSQTGLGIKGFPIFEFKQL